MLPFPETSDARKAYHHQRARLLESGGSKKLSIEEKLGTMTSAKFPTVGDCSMS